MQAVKKMRVGKRARSGGGMQIVKKAKVWFSVLFGLLLLLNVPPLAVTLYYSFIADPFSLRFSGLVNYVEMIGNKYFVQAAGNTALFTCAFVPLLLVISLLLAMHFSGRNTSGTVLISAFILSGFQCDLSGNKLCP